MTPKACHILIEQGHPALYLIDHLNRKWMVMPETRLSFIRQGVVPLVPVGESRQEKGYSMAVQVGTDPEAVFNFDYATRDETALRCALLFLNLVRWWNPKSELISKNPIPIDAIKFPPDDELKKVLTT